MTLLKTVPIIIVVSLLFLPLTQKKVEAGWCTEIVDLEGEQNSLELGSSNNPHLSYYDPANKVLKYAWCESNCSDQGNWQNVTVDDSGMVGKYNSLALDTSGSPRISYFDDTNNTLKYAWCESNCSDQGNWQNVTVDDSGIVGLYTSLALNTSGSPHISYFDWTNAALKYAWCESNCSDPGNWQNVTVDDSGTVGLYTSLALNTSGSPHISYLDDTNRALKYAWCESNCSDQGNWQKVSMDPGRLMVAPKLAIDSNGCVHIIYQDRTSDDLKYARCESNCSDPGNWQKDIPDDDFGDWCSYSLALDSYNNPHISYCGSSYKDLKYIYKSESGWTESQTTNCSSDYVSETSLALDSSDNPLIAYRNFITINDPKSYLKFAFIDVDSDNDGIAENQDNCPNIPNGPCLSVCYTWEEMVPCTTDTDCNETGGSCSMNQKDTYPPGGNGIGDACDCEGNFDCDTDCDGRDAAVFKVHFGRSPFRDPCDEEPLCKGNFDCDLDVDGTDASMFKKDFGRSPFRNPCPNCTQGEWCTYP